MTAYAGLGFAVMVAGVTALTVALRPPRRRHRPTVHVHVDGATRLHLAATAHAHQLAHGGRWEDMLTARHLTLTAQAPDPANPGAVLRLATDMYGTATLPGCPLLLVQDPSQGGRTLALPVPPGTTDPLAAAAWTYTTTPDVYRALARRT